MSLLPALCCLFIFQYEYMRNSYLEPKTVKIEREEAEVDLFKDTRLRYVGLSKAAGDAVRHLYP